MEAPSAAEAVRTAIHTALGELSKARDAVLRGREEAASARADLRARIRSEVADISKPVDGLRKALEDLDATRAQARSDFAEAQAALLSAEASRGALFADLLSSWRAADSAERSLLSFRMLELNRCLPFIPETAPEHVSILPYFSGLRRDLGEMPFVHPYLLRPPQPPAPLISLPEDVCPVTTDAHPLALSVPTAASLDGGFRAHTAPAPAAATPSEAPSEPLSYASVAVSTAAPYTDSPLLGPAPPAASAPLAIGAASVSAASSSGSGWAAPGAAVAAGAGASPQSMADVHAEAARLYAPGSLATSNGAARFAWRHHHEQTPNGGRAEADHAEAGAGTVGDVLSPRGSLFAGSPISGAFGAAIPAGFFSGAARASLSFPTLAAAAAAAAATAAAAAASVPGARAGAVSVRGFVPLPLRVIDALFSFLTPADLNACQLTCKVWNHAVLRSAAWKLALYRWALARTRAAPPLAAGRALAALPLARSLSTIEASGPTATAAAAAAAAAAASPAKPARRARASLGSGPAGADADTETGGELRNRQASADVAQQPFNSGGGDGGDGDDDDDYDEEEEDGKYGGKHRARAGGKAVEGGPRSPVTSALAAPAPVLLVLDSAIASLCLPSVAAEHPGAIDAIVEAAVASAAAAAADSDCAVPAADAAADPTAAATPARVRLDFGIQAPEPGSELPVPGAVLADASLTVPAVAGPAMLALARTAGLRPRAAMASPATAAADTDADADPDDDAGGAQSTATAAAFIAAATAAAAAAVAAGGGGAGVQPRLAPFMAHPAMAPSAVSALATVTLARLTEKAETVGGHGPETSAATAAFVSSVATGAPSLPKSLSTLSAASSTHPHTSLGGLTLLHAAHAPSFGVPPASADGRGSGSALLPPPVRCHAHYTLKIEATSVGVYAISAETTDVPDADCMQGPCGVYNEFEPEHQGAASAAAAAAASSGPTLFGFSLGGGNSGAGALLTQVSADGAEPATVEEAAAAAAAAVASGASQKEKEKDKKKQKQRGVSLRVCSLHPRGDAAELAFCRSLLDQQQFLTQVQLDRARLKAQLDEGTGFKAEKGAMLAAVQRDVAREAEEVSALRKQNQSDAVTNEFLQGQLAEAMAKLDAARARTAHAVAEQSAAVAALEQQVAAKEAAKEAQDKAFLELKAHRKLLSKEVKSLQAHLGRENARTAQLQALLSSV